MDLWIKASIKGLMASKQLFITQIKAQLKYHLRNSSEATMKAFTRSYLSTAQQTLLQLMSILTFDPCERILLEFEIVLYDRNQK